MRPVSIRNINDMQLLACGVNHHTAPVAIRERVAFPPEILPRALVDVTGRELAREAAILSTCNRTEIYCSTAEPEAVVKWMSRFHSLEPREVKPYLYLLPGDQAVKHAFRVASGLDSMVLGETQILGQMKQAADKAPHRRHPGPDAKQAVPAHLLRGQGGALHHRHRRQHRLHGRRRRYPGLPHLSRPRRTGGALRRRGRDDRTDRHPFRRAQTPPADGGQPHRGTGTRAGPTLRRRGPRRSRALPELLPDFDILVTSTASPLPIIGLGMVERAIKLRKHRPMFMVDLAVPRDIEPEVGELPDVFLYTVDDLGAVVRDGQNARQAQVVQAEAIIDASVHEFMRWLDSRRAVPTLRALRDHAERLRRHELEKAHKLLARGEDPTQVLEAMSRALMNKYLHYPSHALNNAGQDEREHMAKWLARIYNLHNE
jgi:glutamyl-tRNA reductase